MIRWQMVTWHGAPLGEPIVLFAEVENEAEVRKVDLFPDGGMRRADRDGGDESTWLSSAAMPSVGEINIQPEFTARDVEKELFEAVWNDECRATPSASSRALSTPSTSGHRTQVVSSRRRTSRHTS